MDDAKQSIITDKKIEKLSKKLSKELSITQKDALNIIYGEWEYIEELFIAHGKVKAVLSHLVDNIKCYA